MTISQKEASLPLPPGSFGLPIIGETISFLRDADFIDKRIKKYGSLFKTSIFGRPTLVLVGAEANRFILTNDKNFAIAWPQSTKILLGPLSLAVQEGSQHQSRRKLLSYAFQPKALAGYLPSMERITLEYLQNWEKQGKLTWYPQLRDYTFDVASSLLIGEDSNSETNISQLFKDWCDGLFTIPIPLPWTKFGRALHCRKEILDHIEKIVLRRQAEQNPGHALGLLLQARDDEGNGLSLPELKDQVLLLLFAGHETLTSALGTLCLSLAQHPEVLAKARTEVLQVAPDGCLTPDNLRQMNYLEMVSKEVLRLVAPVGGGFRQVVKTCEFNGYSIPEGWAALYQIAHTHEDSSIYTNPEQFDPERFSPERAEDKQKPFGYLPFGGGMRECLGKAFAQLVMKVFAAHLVRDYTWELLPNQSLELIRVPTPHPKDGLQVNFRRF